MPGPGGVETATAAGGAHPTGMHSCFNINFVNPFREFESLI